MKKILFFSIFLLLHSDLVALKYLTESDGCLINSISGYKYGVNSAVFSPDGQFIAIGGWENTVELRSTRNRTLIRTFSGHTNSIKSVAFSLDGQTIASAGLDKTINIWRLNDGNLINTLIGHNDEVNSISFSPDKQYLVSGSSDKTIKLWRLSDGGLVNTFTGHTGSVNSVIFSPDCQYVASGSNDETIIIWNISQGRISRIITGHTNSINSISFSPDGQYIVSGSSDETIKIWRLSDGNLVNTFSGHIGNVNSVSFSPDGQYIVSGSKDKTIKIWKVSQGSFISTMIGHTEYITSVSFSPDCQLLVSTSNDGTVKLWKFSDAGFSRTLLGHKDDVNSIGFSPDSKFLASGSSDRTINIWQVGNDSLINTIEGHNGEIWSVCFCPDGKSLLSGSGDESIKLWKVSDGNLISTLNGHTSDVLSVAFCPDRQYFASASKDNTIRLWKVNNNIPVGTLKGHKYFVYSIAFSADGKYLASTGWDNVIRLWRVSDTTLICTFRGHSGEIKSVSFSPDKKYLASGSSDQTVKLWKIKDSSLVYSFTGHKAEVNSVAFSPDGQYLASGSNDNTVKLWKVYEKSLLCTFTGHTDNVMSVAFSPDKQYLATASRDKTIKLWKLKDVIYREIVQHNYPEIFSPKGEFETTEAYYRRRQNANSKVDEFIEQIKLEKEDEIKTKEAELEDIISESITSTTLEIQNLGSYSADKQSFPVILMGKVYNMNVPLSEAPGLKQNWQKARVSCIKKLQRDLISYEYYNIQVINPVNGSIYKVGEWSDAGHGAIINSKSLNEKKSLVPPELKVACSFSDDNGNGFLEGKERGKISASITNIGKGVATGLDIELSCENNDRNITYVKKSFIDDIRPGETKTAVFDVTADKLVKRVIRRFIVNVNEMNGFNPDPVRITFETNSLQTSSFEIVDYGINSSRGDNIIRVGELTDFKIRIQNKGSGIAKNVNIKINIPQNVFFSPESKQSFDFPDIIPGGFADIGFQIFTNRKVDKTIEVPLNVTDDDTSKNLSFRFEIDKPQQSIQDLIIKGNEQITEFKDVGGLGIDIERDIPVSTKKNTNAVALIFSLSDYQNPQVPKVLFAQRDASLMRQYLEKTLGYDRKNILPQNSDELMTSGVMKTYLKEKLPGYLKRDGSTELFVYYVGHGAPNTNSKDAYFVPYDCDPNYVSDINAYNMKEFYNDISKLKASKKIIIVDACFSGQAGNGIMLIHNASPLIITVENRLTADERSIIFQSSESNQISNWYPEKQHSMFTYFFLKGLQGKADLNGDGQITVEEIEKFINDDEDGMPYWSHREFQRLQKAVILGGRDKVILSIK